MVPWSNSNIFLVYVVNITMRQPIFNEIKPMTKMKNYKTLGPK